MVQQAEALREVFARRGFVRQAQAAERFRQEISEMPDTPEVLEGVTVYDRSLDTSLEEGVYRHPSFIHDRDLRTVQLKVKDGAKLPLVKLTATENRFLTELEQLPNKVRTTKELQEKVFDEGHSPYYVTRYVASLRKKIEADPKAPEIVTSLYGQGYVLNDSSKEIREIPVRQEEPVYSHPGFTYYPERSLVVVGGRETSLTATENKLLGLLARHVNRIVVHEGFKHIWEDKEDVNFGNNVTVQMTRLRRKLEPDKRGKDYQYILSVYGIGFKLCDPGKMDNPK